MLIGYLRQLLDPMSHFPSIWSDLMLSWFCHSCHIVAVSSSLSCIIAVLSPSLRYCIVFVVFIVVVLWVSSSLCCGCHCCHVMAVVVVVVVVSCRGCGRHGVICYNLSQESKTFYHMTRTAYRRSSICMTLNCPSSVLAPIQH